jgi:hypothetical protein
LPRDSRDGSRNGQAECTTRPPLPTK